MANKKALQALISIAGQVEPSLQKSLQTASKSFSGVKKAAVATGTAAAAGMAVITTATVKATKQLYKLGAEFDSAQDTIRVGTGATGEALQELYSDMQEVYKNVPTTMEDASSAIADYNTRLGLTGEPLQELSQQAIQVCDLLGEDLSMTIEKSSKAFQQWNIDAGDMSEAMDYIFKVSQSTGTGFNTLMADMQLYGAQLQELGFGFNEASVLIGQMDKAGVNVNEALNAMKKSVSALAAEGLSASEGLSKYYDSIVNAKDATEATTIASEIFGTRAASTMAAAIREGSLSIDDLTASLEASGETINTASTDTYDFAEQFQLLKQNAELALEPIATEIFGLANEVIPYLRQGFEYLIPVFSTIGEAVIPLLSSLGTELFPIATQAVTKFGKIAEKILPFMSKGITQVASFSGNLISILADIADVVMPLLEEGITAVFDVIGQLMPAITQLFTELAPVADLIKQLVSGLLPPIISMFNMLTPIISGVANVISTVLVAAIQLLMPVMSGLISLVSGFSEVFTGVFAGMVEIVTSYLNGIIAMANKAINALNGLNVTIPDWVPGFGGKTFGFDISSIPMLASGGFTDGVSIAGENGTEAVISFDPTYREQNLSYWAKAGQMLGVTDGDILSLIEDAGSGSSVVEYNMGGITYAPNITIAGNASKEDVVAALREDRDEFFDMLDEYMAQKEEDDYAPSY